jgi:RNA polymerase sigma-70 factor (ECF subfamily)
MAVSDGLPGVLTPTEQMPSVAHALAPPHAAAVPAFDEVYAAHVGFVWRVLRTLGVPEAQIEDAVQDVFVVVHRRLGEWQGRAAITTWLFAIARRVAQAHRRRASRNAASPVEPLSEQLADQLVDERDGGGDPFAEMSRAQAAATVLAILEQLDDDKRMVFALVELEQLSVPEVARMLDINLNTAYSRLRLARAAFEAAVKARPR